jgi:hypothetical protein
MGRPAQAGWFGRVIDAGVLAQTVMDNYHWDTTPVAVRLIRCWPSPGRRCDEGAFEEVIPVIAVWLGSALEPHE